MPIFNEQDNIPELHERLKKASLQISHDYELIFVNDGSTDDSLNKLKELVKHDPNAFYINFSRNFGQQIAVAAGLDHCLGETAVIIDGDLQDPPELIPDLYKKHKQGFNVVYAKRSKRKGESFFKKITAKIYYRVFRWIASIDIPVDTGDFRLIDKKVIENLKKMPEKTKFLRGQSAWLGFKQTHIEYVREGRKHGKTAYSLKKMIRFALDGITGFSDKPLKWISTIGIAIFIIALFIIIYALIFNKDIISNASLLVFLVLIGAIQLISIGIIGAYVARINKNIQNRPLYIIEDTNLEYENS
ncbi:glycosyltransferase family 2 protein [Patescibacteria group bacterium]